MKICRVVGTVVATTKAPRLEGFKLLIVAPASTDGEANGDSFVAVDTVGAGYDEVVLVAVGSSARATERTDGAPTDATIVGVVDVIESSGETSYRKP